MEGKPAIKLTKAYKDKTEWTKDPKGYFLIEPRPNEKLIYAHHYDYDGNYEQSVAGENAQEIYYTLLRLNLITTLQHAAYLGAELQKADECLRLNKTYIQDRN